MSILRKIPYIENVISVLDEAELQLLKDLANTKEGGTDLYSLINNDKLLRTHLTETRIECINLELENKTIKTGFLIYKGDVCVFIAFHRFPDMQIYEINATNNTSKQIYEDLTIEEYRRILFGGSGGGSVTPESLAEIITGGSWISADLSEDGQTIVIDADQDLLDEIGSKQEALTNSEDIVVDDEDVSHLHLSATNRNVISRALLTPTQAPTGTVLVAVNPSNSQTSVNVDSSLALANGTLSVPVKNASGTNIDTFMVKKLTQAEYDSLATKDSGTLYIIVG